MDYHGFLGSTLAKMADKEGALKIYRELEELDRPYLFGLHTFWCAQIAAVLGEKEKSMRLLQESLMQGIRCDNINYGMYFEALRSWMINNYPICKLALILLSYEVESRRISISRINYGKFINKSKSFCLYLFNQNYFSHNIPTSSSSSVEKSKKILPASR